MASWSKAPVSPTFNSCSVYSSSISRPFLSFLYSSSSPSTFTPLVLGSSSHLTNIRLARFHLFPYVTKNKGNNHICRAAEYKFPDPIPEFADVETEKFRTHLQKKLSKKGVCGDSIEEVVGICTEIFSTFLHSEYGGPGTLLVIPFCDMADTINERGLPGGPQAARAAVKWAQDHVDKDWKEWTGGDSK
ncbi:protein PLASTID REDOX INSENSITIVE 2, chloroplastic-like [Ricinus communis]|uniref:Protein PLASTID REDOX INSENSITIVE 2, chloroplastic n=1 Tax=Ricinus communis TaxID=3988 RepID=B9T8F8_RICCO|nr:protein PLASTID REDOX INSENSITIVE 2, chloroplastic [Ricinus communis]XP_048231589.1 protein PLASTID REDOX INSENSITIVE 2, chloroplastic-like [Ricinus communis]EEF27857.1 conserved hypothetical protein [Ricinus communis]|eukprot:XP_002534527.1 protein PLASTID REDOX INSENSITIVE 2, chloroplastic [Ricinus communis]